MSKRPRYTTFRRSLLAELTTAAAATFTVLLAIAVIVQLVRLLGQAASGLLAVEGVVPFLVFRAFSYLPPIFSLTVFIAVLLTLTRCYRDAEMMVWFSSGLSLAAWIRPVLGFALPIAFISVVISLWLGPWATSRSDEYRQQLENRDEAAALVPGTFREAKQGSRVFFVESLSASETEGRVSNIFVQMVQNERASVVVAREGMVETGASGERSLVLLDGHRYEGKPGDADYRVASFERYSMRLEAHDGRTPRPQSGGAPTLELLQDPTPFNLAEVASRVGHPLSAVILALIAIPLSFVNPRAGRSANLIVAILLYTIYNNLWNVARVWMVQGKVSVFVGFWGAHLLMLALLAVLFYRRLSVFSPGRFRR